MAYDPAIPVYVVTGVFGGLFIIIPITIQKGPNQGIIRCCVMLTIFCMWIFWVSVYLSQMNPILGPRYTNTTLVWIAHSWGDLPIGTGDRALRTNDENEMDGDENKQGRNGDRGLTQAELGFEGNIDDNNGESGDSENNSTYYDRGDNKTKPDGSSKYGDKSSKSNSSDRSGNTGNGPAQAGAEVSEGSKSNDSNKAGVESVDGSNNKSESSGYESRRHSNNSSNEGAKNKSSVLNKNNTKNDHVSYENTTKVESEKYDNKAKTSEVSKKEFIQRRTEEVVKGENARQVSDNEKKTEEINVDVFEKSYEENKNNLGGDKEGAYDLGLQVQSDNSDSDSGGLSISGGKKINLNEYPQLDKRSASISVIELTENKDVDSNDPNSNEGNGEMIMTTLKTSPINLLHH